MYNDHHFDLITSMAAYLHRSYWCHECKKRYDDRKSHRCENTCKICHSGNCQVSDEINAWTYCAECNRYFKSIQCYQNHKADDSAVKKFGTICSQYYKCKTCQRVVDKMFIRTGTKHECTEFWSRICKGTFRAEHHKCYIKPVEFNVFKKHGKEEKNILLHLLRRGSATRNMNPQTQPLRCAKSMREVRRSPVGTSLSVLRRG